MKNVIGIITKNCPFTCIKGLELDNNSFQLVGGITLAMVSFYHQQPQENPAQRQRQPGVHSPALSTRSACRQGGKRQRHALASGQLQQMQL